MFISEHADSGLIEIECKDVDFIENDSLRKGEINKGPFEFYEIDEPLIYALNPLGRKDREFSSIDLHILDSGSDFTQNEAVLQFGNVLDSGSISNQENIEDLDGSTMCKNAYGLVPCHHKANHLDTIHIIIAQLQHRSNSL